MTPTRPIRLRPGGERFDARDGETVLDAARRAGILLSHSCRHGSCGACRAHVAGAWHWIDGREPLALTASDRAEGVALLCRVAADGPLTVTARPVISADAHELKQLPCRVDRIERASPEVAVLSLRIPSFETFGFRAGQYLDVLLPGGARRAYSLASAPRAGAPLELHVRYRPGGTFSEPLFEKLEAGALLRIEGPLGTFFIRDGDAPIVFVAGGTGFAPFKAMLEALADAGNRREVALWWGASTPAGLYRRGWLDAFAQRHAWFRWTPVVGGYVHERALSGVDGGPAAADVYLAGPPPMVEAGRAAFINHGAEPSRVFIDAFEAAG